MMGRVRPMVVTLWRWVTGPASVAALLLVGAYVLVVSVGLPLAVFWLVGRAVLAVRAATVPDSQAGWLLPEYGQLAVQVAGLIAGWYLARRYLPPFRWKY